MRRQLTTLGKEAVAFARQGKLMLLGKKRPHDALEGDRAIAFVHGYGAAGAVFTPMRAHLEQRLGLPTIDFTYRSSAPFAQITSELAAELARFTSRGMRLDLVGHSLGGLVARWWIQEMDGARHVDRLVTVATPHAGTESARIAPGPLRSVLLPGSAVVRRLAAGRSRAGSVAHTALVAGADLMITPPASAAAIEDAHVFWFEHLGHNAMLFEPEVHDAIAAALAREIAERRAAG
jgi:triacylglycerol lipase